MTRTTSSTSALKRSFEEPAIQPDHAAQQQIKRERRARTEPPTRKRLDGTNALVEVRISGFVCPSGCTTRCVVPCSVCVVVAWSADRGVRTLTRGWRLVPPWFDRAGSTTSVRPSEQNCCESCCYLTLNELEPQATQRGCRTRNELVDTADVATAATDEHR